MTKTTSHRGEGEDDNRPELTWMLTDLPEYPARIMRVLDQAASRTEKPFMFNMGGRLVIIHSIYGSDEGGKLTENETSIVPATTANLPFIFHARFRIVALKDDGMGGYERSNRAPSSRIWSAYIKGGIEWTAPRLEKFSQIPVFDIYAKKRGMQVVTQGYYPPTRLLTYYDPSAYFDEELDLLEAAATDANTEAQVQEAGNFLLSMLEGFKFDDTHGKADLAAAFAVLAAIPALPLEKETPIITITSSDGFSGKTQLAKLFAETIEGRGQNYALYSAYQQTSELKKRLKIAALSMRAAIILDHMRKGAKLRRALLRAIETREFLQVRNPFDQRDMISPNFTIIFTGNKTLIPEDFVRRVFVINTKKEVRENSITPFRQRSQEDRIKTILSAIRIMRWAVSLPALQDEELLLCRAVGIAMRAAACFCNSKDVFAPQRAMRKSCL